jgi:uncharacterized membrane protein
MSCLFTHTEPWIWLAGLLLFLLLYGGCTVWVVGRKKKAASDTRLVALYMALRAFRLLVFIGIVTVYMMVVKLEVKRFVAAAALLYLIYLVSDTLFLTMTEKRLKLKKK